MDYSRVIPLTCWKEIAGFLPDAASLRAVDATCRLFSTSIESGGGITQEAWETMALTEFGLEVDPDKESGYGCVTGKAAWRFGMSFQNGHHQTGERRRQYEDLNPLDVEEDTTLGGTEAMASCSSFVAIFTRTYICRL